MEIVARGENEVWLGSHKKVLSSQNLWSRR